MDKEKRIELLNEKINFIDSLLEKVDWEALEQWRAETLMVLDSLIDSESKYYQKFEYIGFRSGVRSMLDHARNVANDRQAYQSGLERAKAALKAIIFGLGQGLI